MEYMYCESRSPVGPRISRYGNLPKLADLLDRDIGDVDRRTSINNCISLAVLKAVIVRGFNMFDERHDCVAVAYHCLAPYYGCLPDYDQCSRDQNDSR